MVAFVNFINKTFAVFFSMLLTVTGGLNGIFNGNVAPYTDLGGVVGLESLTRAQGVTADDDCFIYSGKNALERVANDNKTVLAINTNAIPDEFVENYHSQHIGGISCYNGIVYAAIEDSKEWNHPIVALYDAKTLKYTGVHYELSAKRHTKGIPWVAVDGENGVLYAGDSANDNSIFMYNLDTMAYIGEFEFAEPVPKIQGGECFRGKMYFGTNDKTRAVYAVNIADGAVEKLFDRIAYEYQYIDNFGGEGEDVTLMKIKGGRLLCTLQVGATFTDATLRGYNVEGLN